MSIEQLKKLREMTQAGVVDALKALKENNYDLDKAANWLREKGIAKANKKAGAIVTEGVAKAVISNNYAAVVEVNSQTDFVSNTESFKNLSNEVMQLVANKNPTTIDELNNLIMASGKAVKDECVDVTIKTGEKVCIRRISVLTKTNDEDVQSYEHFNGRIAVILKLQNKQNSAEIGKGVAMHIAAMNPKFLSPNNVSTEWKENEIKILTQQTITEGKPVDRVEMIVKGRIQKSMAEICLEEQKFVKDPSKTVKQYVQEKGNQLVSFYRYEVGEGVEKKEVNFVDEVAEQMRNK